MRPAAFGIPFPPTDCCFFLDFDGTLVDFAPSPAAIDVPEELIALLGALYAQQAGALAIVTGRALHDIDHHLAPLCLPTAALHGAVRRNGAGQIHGATHAVEFASLTVQVHERLRPWKTRHPGLLVEDKGMALAVHFRALAVTATERQALQQALHEELAAALPDELELLVGDRVLEVRQRGTDKGTAVEAFLSEPAFAGRFPVYLGDDLADVRGMAAVERHGGLAVAVGNRLQTAWQLRTPLAARAWLAAYLQLGSSPGIDSP
jgi:trehalose 6-phosphate phosphatase